MVYGMTVQVQAGNGEPMLVTVVKSIQLMQLGGTETYISDNIGHWYSVRSRQEISSGTPLYTALESLLMMH